MGVVVFVCVCAAHQLNADSGSKVVDSLGNFW